MGMGDRERSKAEFSDRLDAMGIKAANPQEVEQARARMREARELYGKRQVSLDDYMEKEHQFGEIANRGRDRLRLEAGHERGMDLAAAKALLERAKTPEERNAEEIVKADELYRKRVLNEEQYASVRRTLMQDYYREAEGLDAKAIRERLKSGHDKFAEGMTRLRDHGGEIGLSADEIRQEGRLRREEERKRLGISDPLGDYIKSMNDLRKSQADHTITKDEFKKRAEELRQQAVGEMTADSAPIHLSPAMTAGSREAHSVIASAMATNPQLKVAQEQLRQLNRIAAVLGDLKAKAAALQQLIKQNGG
jgi:hypothetical protein